MRDPNKSVGNLKTNYLDLSKLSKWLDPGNLEHFRCCNSNYANFSLPLVHLCFPRWKRIEACMRLGNIYLIHLMLGSMAIVILRSQI